MFKSTHGRSRFARPVRPHGSGWGTIEKLEARTLLAGTLDEQGWTNFTQGEDARTVYVSSSTGNDAWSGLVSSKPVKSIAKAKSLLRDGRGDWMLLKAGDVWYENLGNWTKSGKSKDEPLLISSYGKGERPVLETGEKNGFSAFSVPIKHVAIVGLLFHAHTRDPDSPSFTHTKGGYGLHTLVKVDDLLIENCVFDSYVYNLSIQGRDGGARHVGIRRNVITDAYAEGEKSQGLYVSNASSVLIEGNVFDHNGWSQNPLVPAARANMFSHNVYVDESVSNLYVRDNVIANASSHGLQARGGGTIQGNLFLSNPIGLLFGNGSRVRAGGVEGDVSGNVFLGSAKIHDMARGWAIEIGNTKPGGTSIVAGNVIAHDTENRYAAIRLTNVEGQISNPEEAVGINDLIIEGNVVYRWHSGMSVGWLNAGEVGRNGLNNLVVRNNDFQHVSSNQMIRHDTEINLAAERFQGNRYFNNGDSSRWFRRDGKTVTWDAWYAKVDKTSRRVKVKYDDPERNAGTYNATLGGRPTQGAFTTQARLLARRVWDRRFTATAVVEYMKQGFKVRKIPPVVTATNLSSKNTNPARYEMFFHFSKDVSSKLKVEHLVVTDRNTKQRIAPSKMKLFYDPETNRATWVFPGLTNKGLAAGDYNVTLDPAGVVDVKGTALDGNHDGIGGDPFTRRLKLRGDA